MWRSQHLQNHEDAAATEVPVQSAPAQGGRECLLKSVPALRNVAVVSIIFYVICGILSMQLFMGKFHYCSSDLCCVSTNGTDHCSQVLTKQRVWDTREPLTGWLRGRTRG